MKSWREFSGKIKDYTKINFIRDCFTSRNQPDVVFIWIPKSAGTSIYNAIHARKFKTIEKVKYRFCGKGIVTFGHMSYAELLRQGYISKKFDAGSFKFAIVRDPYDRAVSLYEYLKSRKKLASENQTFLEFLQNLQTQSIDPIGLYNFKGMSHCNPQVRWLEDIKIDFIGRFENLENDLKSIKHKIGILELDIPKKNISKRRSTLAYYCQESLDIVEDIYQEDFDAFSYEIIDRNKISSLQ